MLTALTAQTAGLTRHALAHRLERGRWQRVVPGVYVAHSGQVTRDEAVAAAMVYAAPRQCFRVRMRCIATGSGQRLR